MGKTVIFGATGFVGAYTVLHLKDEGYEVVASGRRSSDNGFFKDYGIEYCPLDIRRKAGFASLPQGDVESIVHFAGAMPAHMQGYNPSEYVDSIVGGTLNVLEYAKEIRAGRIVFSQSCRDVAHLFGSREPIPEESETRFPLTGDHAVYCISKNAAVNLIWHYQAEYGIKAFVLRLPTIYGWHPNPYYYVDGKKRKKGYRILMQKAENGEPIEIWGNPQNVKELVYIDDFTQLVACCLRHGSGGVYNAGNGFPHSFDEQVKAMCEVLNPASRPSKITYRPEMPDPRQFVLGIDKARADLMYSPKFDLKEMFEAFRKEEKLNRFFKLWGLPEDYEETETPYTPNITGGGHFVTASLSRLIRRQPNAARNWRLPGAGNRIWQGLYAS